MLSMDGKVKVVCLWCQHSFPVDKSRVNPESSLPQNCLCPNCRKVAKVKVVRSTLW